jgi:hypothetical protein
MLAPLFVEMDAQDTGCGPTHDMRAAYTVFDQAGLIAMMPDLSLRCRTRLFARIVFQGDAAYAVLADVSAI